MTETGATKEPRAQVFVYLSQAQTRALLAALRLLGQGITEIPEAHVEPLLRGLAKLDAAYQAAQTPQAEARAVRSVACLERLAAAEAENQQLRARLAAYEGAAISR